MVLKPPTPWASSVAARKSSWTIRSGRLKWQLWWGFFGGGWGGKFGLNLGWGWILGWVWGLDLAYLVGTKDLLNDQLDGLVKFHQLAMPKTCFASPQHDTRYWKKNESWDASEMKNFTPKLEEFHTKVGGWMENGWFKNSFPYQKPYTPLRVFRALATPSRRTFALPHPTKKQVPMDLRIRAWKHVPHDVLFCVFKQVTFL